MKKNNNINHDYNCLTNREIQCFKNIIKYNDLLKSTKDKIDLFNKKIDEYTHSIKEINFDIEVIEDPVSRPLGTGQENRRVELLIRQLESEVKMLESKRHNKQCQIVKHKILLDEFASKISFEQNSLVSQIRDFRIKIESKHDMTEHRNSATNIQINE